MLPLTVLGYMVLDSKKGWGATKPEVIRLNTTVDEYHVCLNRWAARSGYDSRFNASGGRSHISYRSHRLTPSSTLDRWQYGLGYVHRPLPEMSVTCLVPNGQPRKQAAVILEIPWVALDSPEETNWRVLIDSLRTNFTE